MVILGIRLASGAVDAVKSFGPGLGRLWRLLVCQPLEPTHDVISHSDPGEAVDRRVKFQAFVSMPHAAVQNAGHIGTCTDGAYLIP